MGKERRPGYIRGEDGWLVEFHEFALEGLDPNELSVSRINLSCRAEE